MVSYLVKHWQSSLAENQRLMTQGSARFQWLRALYVRLYSYLLSSYGGLPSLGRDHSASSPDNDVNLDAPSSRMPFVDFTIDDRGLQPRSPELIRLVLDSVHELNDGAGSTTSGVELERDWRIVATSQNYSLERCRELLTTNNIDSRIRAYGRHWALDVHQKQFEHALECVREHARELRPAKRRWWYLPRREWRSFSQMIQLLLDEFK